MAKDSSDGNRGYNGAAMDEEGFLKRFADIPQAFKHMPGFLSCCIRMTDVFQAVNGPLDTDCNPKGEPR